MDLEVRNPATGELLATVPASSRADVDAAVARARQAQPAWAATPLAERARLMKALQTAILEARDELARIISHETGKPIPEAYGSDILACLDAFKWASTKGLDVLRVERMRLSNPLLQGRVSHIEREPLGVIGIVSPWNYPFSIPGGQVAFSLMAGNTVVLKPASQTPLSMLRLRELATTVGVPADVFIVVPGAGSEAGDALVNAPIDHLIFTGSVPVGHAVDSRLRERGVTSCMELGGSDPALVLHDAVLENAVRGIVWARFTNAGQTCAATKRVYVDRSILDHFVSEVVNQVKALRLGDPLDVNTDIGPLTDPRAVGEMEAFLEDARKRGARVLAGGRARPDLGAQYFEPTVLVDVAPDSRVLTEETFGPILPIIPFSDEDEAVALANATTFGLSASVWTRDTDRGLAIARRIRAGTVIVNEAAYTFAASETPWSGFKDSGHGATHGRWGMEQVTRRRHLNVVPARHPLGSPWWFPYNHDLRETLRNGAAFLYGSASEKAKHGIGVASRLISRRPK